MKIIYSDKELHHHPQYEWNFGKLVPYPEKNIRAKIICDECNKRGMGDMIIAPDSFDVSHIEKVIDQQMVDFIRSSQELNEGESIFPHIFPYRNFTNNGEIHPEVNKKKSGCYCFDVGIELDKDSYIAAKAAVDVALTGAQLIATKAERHVFALSRPPGHHASSYHFGGYCIFNNIAIAAYYLAVRFGKVAIIDVDFHHGNGTQDIFYDQGNVFFASLHGDVHYNYPYFSGFGDERGERLGFNTNLNINLPAGIGDKEYRKYLTKALYEIEKFKPEIILVSLGLDTFKDDPLSDIGLSSSFYKEMAEIFLKIGAPILAVLEGGYDIKDLAENGANFIEGLAEGA